MTVDRPDTDYHIRQLMYDGCPDTYFHKRKLGRSKVRTYGPLRTLGQSTVRTWVTIYGSQFRTSRILAAVVAISSRKVSCNVSRGGESIVLTIDASSSTRLPGASVGANRPPTTLSRQTRSWRALSASILCVQRARAAAKLREFLENFCQLLAIFTRSDGIPDKIWVRPPKAAENPDKNGPRLAGESGHRPSGFRLTYIGIFGGPAPSRLGQRERGSYLLPVPRSCKPSPGV